MNVLAPVDEALTALLAHLEPPPARKIPVAEAVGLVLAADLRATAPVPPAALALRSGYAVRAADTLGASPYSPLVLAAPPPSVAAGGPLPDGTDAVQPGEAAMRLPGGGVEVTESVPAGHWARRAGGEIGAGTVLRQAGERLRALDAAVALAAGVTTVEVLRPIVGLSGGAPGHTVAMVRLLDGIASLRQIGSDVRPDGVDLVLALDHGTNAPSSPPLIGGLALRPGEETRITLTDGTASIHVAARLDAVLAVGWALLLPCLAALTGAAPAPSSQPMPLTRKIASTVGLTEIALLRRVPDGLEPLAVADLTLGALARAEAWLAVPAGSEGFERGALVRGSPV